MIEPAPQAAAPTEGDRRPLRYLPALDGLRAVAVVGVMLFHGGVSWVPGGFLGVDVFFVLSGYLITTLLLRERSTAGFVDLGRFYLRRARRLLPATLVLLAVVAVATPFLVDPASQGGVRADGLSALAYVANWHFVITDQSYFAGAPSPLRHLWSLSVEEQWYLIFPPVVALVLRRSGRIRAFIVGLAVLAVASAVWMAVLGAGATDPSRAYYGTDTRAHALLVGSLLAAIAAQWPIHRARRALTASGLAGGAGVLAAYVLVAESDDVMYRGGFLLFALASAGLVAGIALPRPLPPFLRLLEARPLVAVGRISYGLYLWHWPVDVVLTPARTGLDGGWATEVALLVLRTAVAAGAAMLSYRFVEQPIRDGGLDGLRLRLPGPARSRPATAFGCVALVVWLLVAATVHAPSTTPSALSPEVAAAEVGVPDDIGPVATVPAAVREVAVEGGLEPVPEDRLLRVLLGGDSAAWSLALRDAPLTDLDVTASALIGCGVADGLATIDGRPDPIGEHCPGWERYWQQGAVEGDPDVLMVMFGAWEVYDYQQDDVTLPNGSPEMAAAIREGLDSGVRAVLAVDPDVRVLVVGAPCMNPPDLRLGYDEGAAERLDLGRLAWANEQFRSFADSLGRRAAYVDLGQLLCPDGEFRAEIDGVEIRPDGLHYEPHTTDPTWDFLEPHLRELARTPVPGAEARMGADRQGDAGDVSLDPAEAPIG